MNSEDVRAIVREEIARVLEHIEADAHTSYLLGDGLDADIEYRISEQMGSAAREIRRGVL